VKQEIGHIVIDLAVVAFLMSDAEIGQFLLPSCYCGTLIERGKDWGECRVSVRQLTL
jgi:hypothetical protein